ncbi:hypothetical protein Q3G72_002908 [Acer saccharum]|nr:hypothetical protein Q3G72_002908 [Acer saccharum]
MNAPCPWKVELGTDEVDLDTQWYIKIKEFLAGSNQIEDVILTLTSKKKHSFNFDECRESSPSFPRVIGNLDVGIYEQSEHYAVLLDGLLEVCYPRTLSVFLDKDSSFIEWLYEKLMNVGICYKYAIQYYAQTTSSFKIRKDQNTSG